MGLAFLYLVIVQNPLVEVLVLLLAVLQKHSSLVVVVPATPLADLSQKPNLVAVVVPPVGTLLPGSAWSLSADSKFVDLEAFGPVAPQTTTLTVENLMVGLHGKYYVSRIHETIDR